MIPFDRLCITSLTLSPALVPTTGGGNEQTFTLTGLATTDVILSVVKPTTQAGLGIGNARVSAANTLAINFINASGGDITPTAAQVYTVTTLRPEKKLTSVAQFNAM